MFTTPTPARGRQRITVLLALAVQSLPVVLLVLASRPIFVAPSSVATGQNGSAVTSIYWPDASPRAATSRLHPRISWPRAAKIPQPTVPEMVAQTSAPVSSANQAAHALAAGSPYGSASDGPFSGHDIRPALPMSEHDPVVDTELFLAALKARLWLKLRLTSAAMW